MKTGSLIMFCFLAVAMMGTSCKKAAEQQADDIIKKLMTDGTWYISKFMEGSTETTASYSGWVFKFNDNNTVTATSGTTVQTGTWQSNATTNQTISAQFATSVGNPIIKLNGTWTINASAVNKGNFAQTVSGVNYAMELTKY